MEFQYLIAFGSNVEPRLSHICQGLEQIETIARITARSSLYYTDPIGPANLEFVNGAITVVTKVEPQEMMQKLLFIESALGRQREVKWGNRTIDLDIILIKNEVDEPISSDNLDLKVPHPHMRERDFVLQPAQEIAGHWEVSGTTLTELANACEMSSILRVKEFPTDK